MTETGKSETICEQARNVSTVRAMRGPLGRGHQLVCFLFENAKIPPEKIGRHEIESHFIPFQRIKPSEGSLAENGGRWPGRAFPWAEGECAYRREGRAEPVTPRPCVVAHRGAPAWV
jgi:hypothetical protein